jgi:hypothetical protein
MVGLHKEFAILTLVTSTTHYSLHTEGLTGLQAGVVFYSVLYLG